VRYQDQLERLKRMTKQQSQLIAKLQDTVKQLREQQATTARAPSSHEGEDPSDSNGPKEAPGDKVPKSDTEAPPSDDNSGMAAPAPDDQVPEADPDSSAPEGKAEQKEEEVEVPVGLPTLYVVHEHVSDEDFPRFYKSSDVFVLPSRGEGWGRPHAEAMSMGLPIIATNWSGTTAFLDDSVGYPLPIEGLVPVNANKSDAGWFGGLQWAQPSVSELRRLMRHVFDHREEAAAKGVAARRRMVEKYSPGVVADVVLREVLRVQVQLRQRLAAAGFHV
jgi:glycosyltransferase involved in cell wall biosynthesis